MANVKISDLTQVTEVANEDLLVISNATTGGTRAVSASNLLKGAISLNGFEICNDDLNNITDGTTFLFGNTVTNRPCDYGVAIGIGSDTYKFQIAFSTDGLVYKRRNINASGWTAWEAL